MTVDDIASSIVGRLPDPLPTNQRFVIAVAGPPAAGKSTLAAALVDSLGGRAGLLAMDGYHLDNTILEARGDRPRKGAPHTFDVVSYASALESLRNQPGIEMAVPVFDRELDLSRNCASMVTSAHTVVVTEGNYLLLDAEPWSGLGRLFDLTVWLDVAIDVVEQRIRQRWQDADLDAAEIVRRTEENDLPNGRLVCEHSVAADIVV